MLLSIYRLFVAPRFFSGGGDGVGGKGKEGHFFLKKNFRWRKTFLGFLIFWGLLRAGGRVGHKSISQHLVSLVREDSPSWNHGTISVYRQEFALFLLGLLRPLRSCGQSPMKTHRPFVLHSFYTPYSIGVGALKERAEQVGSLSISL